MVVAQPHQRGVAIEQHHGVARIAHVDLRHARGHVSHAQRIQQPPRQHRPGRVVGFARRRGQPVDDGQVEVRVIRSVLVDHDAVVVDEIERAVDAPDAQRMALLHGHVHGGRQRAAQQRVGHPRRIHDGVAPLIKVHREHALAAKAVKQRQHLAVREPVISMHHNPLHAEHRHVNDADQGAMRRVAGEAQQHRHRRRAPSPPRPAGALAARLQVRAAESLICRCGDRHQ